MSEGKKVKQKTNIEILNEIRNQRNEEITSQKRTDISVTLVEFLGKGEQTEEKFFRLFEQQEFEDKPTQVFEKYYIYKDESPVLIAVKNPETGEILPVGMQGDENKSWDIEKADIEKCIEVREKEYEQELKMMAKELGIKEKEIAGLSIEELSRKVAEKESSQKGEKKDKDDDTKELTDEQIKNIGGFSNEVNLDVVVDDRGTKLRDVLKLKEFESIMPVPSYKVPGLNSKGENGENPNVPFTLVGKRKDGAITTLPTNKIRLYRGGNTESTKINDADSVEHKCDEENMYEVVGTNKRLIVNQEPTYGRANIYLGEATRTNDGNVAQKLQDRYRGTETTDVEVRALFNENKGEDQTQEMQDEAESHFENPDCQASKDGEIKGSKAIDAVDGNKNTGHQHSEDGTVIIGISPELIKMIAEKCKVSEKTAEEYAEQISDENNIEKMTEEEIVNEAQDIAARDYDPRAISRTRNI